MTVQSADPRPALGWISYQEPGLGHGGVDGGGRQAPANPPAHVPAGSGRAKSVTCGTCDPVVVLHPVLSSNGTQEANPWNQHRPHVVAGRLRITGAFPLPRGALRWHGAIPLTPNAAPIDRHGQPRLYQEYMRLWAKARKVSAT